MALRFGDLAYGLGIRHSVWHALLRPSGAGGGLPPPRGNTAARPANHYCASGEDFFVFIVFCDICNIDMHNCLGDIICPSLWYLLEPLGAILKGLGAS